MKQQINEAIYTVLQLDDYINKPGDIKASEELCDDLCADSLDIVELAIEIENVTGLVTDDKYLKWRTVADIYNSLGVYDDE